MLCFLFRYIHVLYIFQTCAVLVHIHIIYVYIMINMTGELKGNHHEINEN